MKTFQNFRLIYGVFWLAFFAAVISVCGCQPDYVPTPPVAPTASFSYTSARVFPVQVSFINTSTSTIPGPSTFIWDFGDGSTSTITNPVHFYPVAGTYMVSLVQIYSNATRDTVIKALQLNPTGPSGVSSKQNGTAATDFAFTIPSIYLVSFTNTSTNATSYLWEFGDATSSTSAATTVTHQYTGTGPFNVKMTATGGGGSDTCSAQIVF
ncbi:MAG: PKD domain-containing protein [Ferruginibacter sp.]|nr:PKD domain-containing protein [Ferruginibacter sp.]